MYYRYQITCPGCQFQTGMYEEGQQEVLFAKWNRRPSSPATNNDLHRQIMKLPHDKSRLPGADISAEDAYFYGHCHALQSAAELALQFSPAPVNTQGGLREALKETLYILEALTEHATFRQPVRPDAVEKAHEFIAKGKSALAQAEQEQPASPRILSRCPACHNDTLTINDGHLLCTWHKCPNPTLIDTVQEFPSSTGNYLQDSAEALYNLAPEARCTAVHQEVSYRPGCSVKLKATFWGHVHLANGLISAEAETLPGVYGQIAEKLSQHQ